MKTSKEKAQQAMALRLKAADKLANSRANVQKWHDSTAGAGSSGRGNAGERAGEREQKNLVAQQDLANVTQRAQLTLMESELNLR